jgi:hypothetical protein
METENLNTGLSKVYTRVKMPFPLSNRDFMKIQYTLKRDNEIMVVYYSVDHPLQTGFERG